MLVLLARTALFTSTFLLAGLVYYIREHPPHLYKASVATQKVAPEKPSEAILLETVSAKDSSEFIKAQEGEVVPAGSHIRFKLDGGSLEYKPPATPKKMPISNKWKKRFSAGIKPHIEALMSGLSGNAKLEGLLEELEEEAHGVDVGAGILHSQHLEKLLSLVDRQDITDSYIPQLALSVLKAALHNNEHALMRVKELNLMPRFLTWIAKPALQKKSILILHSLVCHQMEGEDGSLKDDLAKQLKDAGGKMVLSRIQTSDPILLKKYEEILASIKE